jgi:hypothetical protein
VGVVEMRLLSRQGEGGREMNGDLLIEAVEVAVNSWEYEGEEYKAEIGRMFLKTLREEVANV